MKIWNGYGSEHSMNLVMIGSFKKAGDAEDAKDLINEIAELVRKEPTRSYDDDPAETRFSKEMSDFFLKANLMTIGAIELEQFNYDVSVEQKGNQLILKTDEADISAFLKLLIDKGAKVEVFSAHEYPESEQT
jgi:Family of unknown function (DUF6375)